MQSTAYFLCGTPENFAVLSHIYQRARTKTSTSSNHAGPSPIPDPRTSRNQEPSPREIRQKVPRKPLDRADAPFPLHPGVNRILSIMDSNDIITAAHYLAMEESVSPDSTVCSKYDPVGPVPPESPPTADLRFYDFSCLRADGASAGIGAGRDLAIRSAIFPESL